MPGSKNESSSENFNKYASGQTKSTKYSSIQFAEVMNVTDKGRMGRIQVWLQGSRTNKMDPTNWKTVLWSTPFGGVTPTDLLVKGGEGKPEDKTENTFAGTQRSYGMHFGLPHIGNIVIVAFIDGNSNLGVCLGCMYQPGVNHMVPGIPRGTTFGEKAPLVPVAETNRASEETQYHDLYKNLSDKQDGVKRAKHDTFYSSLITQGLENDGIRGLTDSGARRESPSQVYGILTPGGHQFVMDDAGQKYTRLRTSGGAQILLDDSNSTVYVVNSAGTGWVEITKKGKIEVWSEDSISVRSEKDINLRADRDLNIESGRHINIRAHQTDANSQPKSTTDLGSVKGNVHIESAGSFKLKADVGIDTSTGGSTNIYSTINNNLTALATSNINSAGGHFETASVIHMNGPIAALSTPVAGITLQADAEGNLIWPNVLAERTGSAANSPRKVESYRGSIVTRYPTREPYAYHESQNTLNSNTE